MLIYRVMHGLIEYIKCNITIIINWLPVYQIILLTYFTVPVFFISYYHYKKPKTKSIFLAFILLGVWLTQMFLWMQGYNIYYQI